MLNEVGMKLKQLPRRPRWQAVSIFSRRNGHYKEWLPFLNTVDFAYWNVELDQD